MILVDTSVWIGFLSGSPLAAEVQTRLERGDLACHPFVRGELALGQLGKRRADFLSGVDSLPLLEVASHSDVLKLIDMHALSASGIGWVDAHLLTACIGSRARLWTIDRALRRATLRVHRAGVLRTGT